MAKTQLVSNLPAAVQAPGGPTPLTGPRFSTTDVEPTVGLSIDQARGEINDAFADMRTFYTREPDEVIRMCSGHSARLSELRVRIQRVEDMRREWRNVRTREIEPALEELERQYAAASRLHSIRELDFRLSGGQV
jgi:hypothetical protein